MSFLLNILLCFAFNAAIAEKNTRIIGGKDDDSFEYPYHASIQRLSDNEQICGGAIITNIHIITTAHCVDSRYVNHNNILISTGKSRKASLSGFIYFPLIITLHPAYTGVPDPITRRLNDIAIITVRGEIFLNNFQLPIELPRMDVVHGDIGVVVGAGSIENPPNLHTAKMQSAWMRVLDMNHCVGKVPFPVLADQFCAFQREGVGVSLGDGGSPLAIYGTLIGLVESSRPYATGEPELYVNVYSHMDFIESVLLSNNVS